MRVLLYSLNYAPELVGIGKYNTEMLEWLARRGHEVRAIVAPAYYPRWQVEPGLSGSLYSVAERNGVRIYRCPLWVPRKPTGLRRVVHLLSFMVSSAPVLAMQWRWKPDVVLLTEPPLVCAPSVLAFCTLSGSGSWLHVQDLEVDTGLGLGLIPKPGLRGMIHAIERQLLRRFARLTTISGAMRRSLIAKTGGECPVGLMRNWVDADAIRPADSSGLRAELGIPADAVVCLYSGSMGAKHGLELLAESARLLADDASIWFVFCGEGAMRDRLVEASEGLPRVRFLPLQPAERLAELLSMGDIHLLPQRAEAADHVMPSKLAGIFAVQRPVVATALERSELAHALAGRGLVVPPGNAQAFAGAIALLAANPSQRHKLGMAGRAYAEQVLDIDVVLSEAIGPINEPLPSRADHSTAEAPIRTPDP